jgi:hypothetical protein
MTLDRQERVHGPEPAGGGVEISGAVVIEAEVGVELLTGEEAVVGCGTGGVDDAAGFFRLNPRREFLTTSPRRRCGSVWNFFEEACSRSDTLVRQAQRRVLPPEVDEARSTLA